MKKEIDSTMLIWCSNRSRNIHIKLYYVAPTNYMAFICLRMSTLYDVKMESRK